MLFTLSIQLCSYTHSHIKLQIDIHSTIDNSSAIAGYNFENTINQVEDEGEKDCEVPGELARLLQQEERAIQPHEEPVKTINLGTEIDRKQGKISTILEVKIKHRLIQMLHDYVEIFT